MNKQHFGLIILAIVAIVMMVGLGLSFMPNTAQQQNQRLDDIKQALVPNSTANPQATSQPHNNTSIEVKDEIACLNWQEQHNNNPTPNIVFYGWTQSLNRNAKEIVRHKSEVVRGSQIVAFGANGEEQTAQFFQLLRQLNEKYAYKFDIYNPLQTGCLKIRYAQFAGQTYIYFYPSAENQP